MKKFLQTYSIKDFSIKKKPTDIIKHCRELIGRVNSYCSNNLDNKEIQDKCFEFAIDLLRFCKNYFFGQLYNQYKEMDEQLKHKTNTVLTEKRDKLKRWIQDYYDTFLTRPC